jgi:exosome complex RNA-binding protein Csl4
MLKTPTGPVPSGIGKRAVQITVTDTQLKMIETSTQETLQVHMLSNVVGATFVAKENIVVFCVLSADNRCSVQLAHIVRVDKGTTLSALLQSARPLKSIRKGSVVANESARDIVVQAGMYLGFIKVAKNKGSAIVAGAIAKNSECRATVENLRLKQKLPKSARLLGVSKSNDFGTHVQQFPVMLVVTPRSFRIVDAITGDTISKFFIKQICYQ